MPIFAHISGPTGSGKTTLGKLIKKMFPNVIIQDLDEFSELSVNSDMKKMEKDINKLIIKFCKKNNKSPIIFTGTNSISSNRDFSDAIYYKIDAKYKYFINIDTEIVLRRRFERHIEYMKNNIDHYFNKCVKKGKLIIDFELWEKKIKEPYKSGWFHKNNYIFLDNKQICKDIKKNMTIS